MVGITSFGVYIPFNRLQRKIIGEAFGEPAGPGEKAVANYDEDSVSMAVESGRDCLQDMNRSEIGAVYFATTTAPYREKSSATTIAAALDLDQDIRTIDFGDTLRAGSSAMLAAADAVRVRAKQVLVCASDCRLGAAQGQFEQHFGDGAAAFTFGKENPVAVIEESVNISQDFLGYWRTAEDKFERAWEERFIISEGYNQAVAAAVKSMLEKAGLAPRDIARLILYGPTPRYQAALAASLGFNKEQVQDSLYLSVGNAGTANAPMMLVAALEEAKPGDRVLFVTFGEGSDAILFRVTGAIESFRPFRGIQGHLHSKKNGMSYQTYLKWRSLLSLEPGRRPEIPRPSAPAMWRAGKKNLAFYGSRCLACGLPQYPPQRICAGCQTWNRMEDYPFLGKKAHIVTYTADYLKASPDPPTVFVVVDFEAGGRIFCEMTDCEFDKLSIGAEVELTFRKLYEAGGIHNYYWKVRPKR